MDYPALLARLLPPGSYSISGEKLSAELNSEGAALSAAQSSASKVASGVLPDGGAAELLPDWERVYGITPASSAATSSRVAAIQARMRAVGGLSRAFFIEIAVALGYTITITELTPFRASRNRVGDVIAVPGVVYAWRVSVFGVAAAPDLEALFRELKPAHTAVTFIYPAGSIAGAMSGSITVGTASLTGSIRLVNARTDAFVPIAGRACTCGVFSMTSAGVWTYVLDSHDPDAVALPSKATLAESVTVSASDGSLSGTVLITVVGIDDAGTISGTDTGNVTEDVTTTCSGVLTVTDPDTGDAVFVAQTTSSSYGTFVLAKTGVWSYALGAGAQALPGGSTVSDTFTARSVGGASHVVSITITGTNDVAVITGTATGAITVGDASVSGALVVTDVDTGQAAFAAATTAGTYGALAITAAGAWTYTIDMTNPAVTTLAAGATITDQIAVFSVDRSASRTISISITGAAQDPFASSVILALASNGTSLVDLTARHAVANHGAAISASGASLSGNGYVSVADSPDFAIGSGDFTLELLLTPSSTNENQVIFCQSEGQGSGYKKFYVQTYFGHVYVQVVSSPGVFANVFEGVGTISAGTKTHVEIGRKAGTWYLFIGGALIATSTAALAIPDVAADVALGQMIEGAYQPRYGYYGVIHGCRMTTVCRHIGAFTPPTSFVYP